MLKTLLRYSLPLIFSSGAYSAESLRQDLDASFLSSDSPSFRALALEKHIIWNTYTPSNPHLTLKIDDKEEESTTDDIYKTLVEDNKKCGKRLTLKNYEYLERAVINGDQLACITYLEYLCQLSKTGNSRHFTSVASFYLNNLDRHARNGSLIAFMILDLGLGKEVFGKRTVNQEIMTELQAASKDGLKEINGSILSLLKNRIKKGINRLMAAQVQRIADGNDANAKAAQLELIQLYWQGNKGLPKIAGNRLAIKYAYENPDVAKMLIEAFNNNEMKLRRNVRWGKEMIVEVLKVQSMRGEAYFQSELLSAYEFGRYGLDASDIRVKQEGFSFAINVLKSVDAPPVSAKRKKVRNLHTKQRGGYGRLDKHKGLRNVPAKQHAIQTIQARLADFHNAGDRRADIKDFRIMFKRLCEQQWAPLLNNPLNYQNYVKYVLDMDDENDEVSSIEGFRFSQFANVLMNGNEQG